MAIYILEDDPGVSDSLSVFLEQLGYDVTVFADAESFFRREPPTETDTVIVDLGLPGIKGTEAIRWINGLVTRPKVLVISGQPRNEIERQFNGTEVPVVLRKPLTEASLVPWL
ncbi:response regulator [Rhodobium gokarnense]|uniref:DNA-binding response OmpR family regulator n=1 Tax=Rhodobium gokarnense TaxID=364296 RepID=A0ABT3H7U4_9HYPH|nr:response regulator [Rhodobium gokarnense]MCW2306459.1 DNA-binding response OmpR family regulator [Rhodobium gokarnense]